MAQGGCMKTNTYFNTYIDAKTDISKVGDVLDSLIWEDKTWGIRIEPEHFTYFSFKVTTKEGGGTLQVKRARDLAHWLLRATNGLEETHGIMDEILQRKKIIKGTKMKKRAYHIRIWNGKRGDDRVDFNATVIAATAVGALTKAMVEAPENFNKDMSISIGIHDSVFIE